MLDFKKIISDERVESFKKGTDAAGRAAVKAAKYGAVFSGGVLTGTLLGVLLFFKISGDDV